MTEPGGSMGLHLTRIRVYPLKGAGGCDLAWVGTDPLGIPGDRRWMLVGPDGMFLSQRTHPRLSQLRVRQGKGGEGARGDHGSHGFVVEGPGTTPLVVRPGRTGPWTEVRVHRDRFEARAGFESESAWFSAFLGERCSLVFFPAEVARPVDPTWAPGHRVGFADGFPLLLTSEASLQDLNRRLPSPVSMLRFRPNLVVRGGAPWEEDGWRGLQIGDVLIELVRPCARCSVVTVDPGSASRGREPLRTLRTFRRHGGKVFFGQNAVFSQAGILRVGDNVHILGRGERRPPLPDPEPVDFRS